MDISLRPLTPEDNPVIAELIRTVFREFKIDRPGTVYTDPTTDHLYELFRLPRSCYWIAEVQPEPADTTPDNSSQPEPACRSWGHALAGRRSRRVLGGCGIYPTPGLPDDCAELVKLYVKGEYRGQGIGMKLMQQCFESAVEMGYKQLYLETLPELGKAVSMYERAGFRYIPARLGASGHYSCHIWMLKNLVG